MRPDLSRDVLVIGLDQTGKFFAFSGTRQKKKKKQQLGSRGNCAKITEITEIISLVKLRFKSSV